MAARKIDKSVSSVGRDGQRTRRSPRISALDSCKLKKQQNHTKKRKFYDDDHHHHDHVAAFASVSKLAKQVWKGRDSPQDADHSADCIDWRSRHEYTMVKETQNRHNHGKTSIMPAKHLLELVLDTLQRRDTYEIFAEPVDPDEVENYYEIIKEPMDFGTMRAKLHEGMYKTLEQFEHDVFLIPENAMYFNSSATIYFRQGRAIHDLAKKVFDALKTDPENFVSEFSGTRRRSMRKALSSNNKDFIAKSGLVGTDVSFKGTVLHSPSTSTFRKKIKNNPGCAGAANHFYARNISTGGRDGRLQSSQAANRHSIWQSFYDEKNPIGLTSHNSYKRLFLMMNEGDIRYKESLMSYVKDLGPIAEMVAKRKLQEHQDESKNSGRKADARVAAPSAAPAPAPAPAHAPAPAPGASPFRTFRDFSPATNPFLNKAKDIIDLTKEEINGKITTNIKEKSDYCEKSPVTLKTTTRSMGLINTDFNCSSSSRRRHSNSRRVRPVILALENLHSHHINNSNSNNVAELKTRNKKSCIDVPLRRTGPHNESANTTSTRAGGPPLITTSLAQLPLPLPSDNISPFTFDLPFLEARLSQMNASNNKNRPSSGEVLDIAPSLNCTRQAADYSMPTINHFLFNHSKPTPSSQSLDSSKF